MIVYGNYMRLLSVFVIKCSRSITKGALYNHPCLTVLTTQFEHDMHASSKVKIIGRFSASEKNYYLV
jgi:hypothetical protein